MINDGCGLCVKVGTARDGRALFVKCEKVGEDVVVRDTPTPYVVATEDTETSWVWGHYFSSFEDAVEYLQNSN